jgi:hypothetical protein
MFMKKTNRTEKYGTNISVPHTLADQLRKLADSQGRTVKGETKICLEIGIKAESERAAA